MAKKLLANNEYFEPVCRTIEARYASGKMGYGCYLFWSSLMEHSADAELFLSTLLDNSPSIRKYRRKTPFIGILTEQERQQALDELTFY
jgi:hypothetical protein